MSVWEHKQITDKELNRSAYYRRWYRCDNSQCKTTIVHNDKFKVSNCKDVYLNPEVQKDEWLNPEPFEPGTIDPDEKPPWE